MSRAAGTVWAAVLLAGLGTFLLRASFLALGERSAGVPADVEAALRFVPPAILAALVLPAVLVTDGSVVVLGNHRLLAGAVAGVVAWRTENILATILVGVGALLALGVAT